MKSASGRDTVHADSAAPQAAQAHANSDDGRCNSSAVCLADAPLPQSQPLFYSVAQPVAPTVGSTPVVSTGIMDAYVDEFGSASGSRADSSNSACAAHHPEPSLNKRQRVSSDHLH
jgi:hypothetical protein